MKKIPTLFEREYEGHRITGITTRATAGCEWVLAGEGVATVKYDGSCCAIINGEFYKRYDAKNGKRPPIGAIACCAPDPITGHHPHWVKVDADNPSDQWFVEAYNNTDFDAEGDGTYEAIGPHFQGNPYNLNADMLVKHGAVVLEVERTFEGIKRFLHENEIEGLVFWRDGEPGCKIKRSDFGFKWS